MWVLQCLPQQIFERRRSKAQSPARAPHDVGRLAHRLGAAGEHGIRLAQQNQLRALRDRFEPRTAQAIHGDRGRFDRQTGLEADVPGHVDGVGRRLEGVSKNRMSEIARGNAGALDGVAGRGRA